MDQFGPLIQREFLKCLGIDLRLKMTLQNASIVQKQQIKSEHIPQKIIAKHVTSIRETRKRLSIVELFWHPK